MDASNVLSIRIKKVISNKILVPYVNTCFRVGGYWNVLLQLVDDEVIYNDNVIINYQNYGVKRTVFENTF